MESRLDSSWSALRASDLSELFEISDFTREFVASECVIYLRIPAKLAIISKILTDEFQ